MCVAVILKAVHLHHPRLRAVPPVVLRAAVAIVVVVLAAAVAAAGKTLQALLVFAFQHWHKGEVLKCFLVISTIGAFGKAQHALVVTAFIIQRYYHKTTGF